MPSSAASVKPSASHLLGERVQVAGVLEHLLGDRQPAQPVADLGQPGPPQSVSSLLPDPRWPRPRRLACFTRSASAGSSSSGIDDWIVGGRPVTTPSRAELDAGDQLVERLHERRDAVAQQLVGHVLHVDAGVGQRLAGRRDGSWSAVAPRDLELLGGGEQRGHRHRVDRVRAPRARPRTWSRGTAGSFTPVDAHSGRCTGQPASRSAAKRSPWKISLKLHVGGARVGDRRLAAQVLAAVVVAGACPPRCPRARRRSWPPSARRATRRLVAALRRR